MNQAFDFDNRKAQIAKYQWPDEPMIQSLD